MRRRLAWATGVVAVLLVALAGAAGVVYSRAASGNAGELAFENRLRIPPLLEPRVDDSGRRVFDLELREGETELLPGKPAETWGVNGPHLGPTLRAGRGDRVRMHVDNELPETTTIHWHGMHLPAAADGGPHQMIEPGETWSPEWTIDQPAATLWYHPHLMGQTEDHVYRGLAGMFILDDPRASRLPLPHDYGVDDIPVIIQDKRFDDDGRLDFSQSIVSPIGRLGDTILVNGTYAPYLDVADRLVRLRLLNASTARIYDVGFADDREFALIATGGGLLEAPRRMRRIQLSVGERAEIVVALSPGERVVLRSFEPDLGTNPFEGRFSGADDSFDLLELRAADQLDDSPELPLRLVAPEGPSVRDVDRVRRFELGSREINGRKMDMGRIDQVVRLGATEIWEVENTTGTPHSFHAHDIRFRVLEYGGEPPSAALSGPKDTVYVPPGKTVRLLTSFEDYADPDLPYMFHCHILEHEDRGMMGQFVVVGKGYASRERMESSAAASSSRSNAPLERHPTMPSGRTRHAPSAEMP